MVAGGIRVRQTIGNDPVLLQLLKYRESHAKQQKHDYSHVFRKKSNFDITRICCIMLGIEFAYAAETAFVSPILLKIGIEHKHMTMVWGLSPFFGFFLSPLMASLTDRSHLGWGRRRPLIFLLSIGLLIGLLCVPWGRELGTLAGDLLLQYNNNNNNNYNRTTSQQEVISNNEIMKENHLIINDSSSIVFDDDNIMDTIYNSTNTTNNNNNNNNPLDYYKWAVIFTIFGTIFLDFSADTLQTPSRTYLLDVTISDDHAKSLSIYTIMAGIGGFLGYSMSAIDWDHTYIGMIFGENVKTVFVIVTIVFIITAIVTLTSFREIPLRLLEDDELLRPISQDVIRKEIFRKNDINYKSCEIVNSRYCINATRGDVDIEKVPEYNNGTIPICNIINNGENVVEDDQRTTTTTSLGSYLKSILIMPKSMKILCLTNLFSWMAEISYSLYFTDFVGEAVFHGDPLAPIGSDLYLLYGTGVRFGCWGLAICAISSSIYSITVERLIKLLGARFMYVSGLLIFGTGMLFLAIFPTKWGVLLFSITAGILFSTIYTIPYIIMANYHAKDSFKMKCGENVRLKQPRGLGTDMAIICNMMFIAQMIVSAIIGPIIAYFQTTTTVIYAASIFSILSAITATQVLYLDL